MTWPPKENAPGGNRGALGNNNHGNIVTLPPRWHKCGSCQIPIERSGLCRQCSAWATAGAMIAQAAAALRGGAYGST